MSGVALTLQPGDVAITRHLAELAQLDATGYTRARREIGEFLVGEVQDNIRGQRLVDGTRMPASAAATERGGKTLQDRGHLRDSYVYQLTDTGLEVGSALIYAAIHHAGGKTGRAHSVTLPARPVLGLTPEGEHEVGEILLAELRALPGHQAAGS